MIDILHPYSLCLLVMIDAMDNTIHQMGAWQMVTALLTTSNKALKVPF